MISLSRILETGGVRLNLEARKKKEALIEMVDLLYRAGRIQDPATLSEALIAREKSVSTGIGDGIAIPHAMISGISETLLAFGRKREGLPFDALDGKPVQLVFLLAGPEKQELTHLQLLSRLARFLKDDRFKTALLAAETEEEVLKIFREQEKKEA